MSKHAADEDAPPAVGDERDSEDDEPPQIPEGVVRAAEQLNRGESVSKEEMMSGLTEVADSDE